MDLHREHGARAQDKGQGTGKGTSDLILIFRFLCWVGQQYYSVSTKHVLRKYVWMYLCVHSVWTDGRTGYVCMYGVCK